MCCFGSKSSLPGPGFLFGSFAGGSDEGPGGGSSDNLGCLVAPRESVVSGHERKKAQAEELLTRQTEGDHLVVAEEFDEKSSDGVARNPELEQSAVLKMRIVPKHDKDHKPEQVEAGVVERRRVHQVVGTGHGMHSPWERRGLAEPIFA